jgi:hypothetical protein
MQNFTATPHIGALMTWAIWRLTSGRRRSTDSFQLRKAAVLGESNPRMPIAGVRKIHGAKVPRQGAKDLTFLTISLVRDTFQGKWIIRMLTAVQESG